MSVHKILITEPIDQRAIDFLSDQGCEISVGTRGKLNTEDALITSLKKCDGAITMLSNPITRRVMESCPNVKVYANYAVGFNNVDVVAAKDLGIRVSNTPDVLSEATADIALSLLLGVSRKIVEADADLRDGKFDGWHPNGYVGVELFGKKAGIIGMGRIGKAIVRRLKGFGISTLYHNRNRIDIQTEQSLDATFASDLDDMLSKIDFLFLSCPLTPNTHHIVNATRLSKLDSRVIIINTGRGPLIDEAALALALIDGKISGAGLDVFEKEPEIHPLLLSAPNTLLLPHIGSATRETRYNMAMLCANSVLKILRGENPNLISNLIA